MCGGGWLARKFSLRSQGWAHFLHFLIDVRFAKINVPCERWGVALLPRPNHPHTYIYGTFDEIYGSWGREISKSDMATATGIAQNGKLYVSSKTKNSAGNYYIWSCITEDYFWKVIGEEQSIFQIGKDNYYWYGLSTSENITKA